MNLLNEIYRIQNLMSINEATNPIVNFLLKPIVEDAWKAFKSEFNNSAISIGQQLDQLSKTSKLKIENLASSKGINTNLYDTSKLIDNLLSKNLNNADLSELIMILSENKIFNENIKTLLIGSKEFQKTLKSAIELSGEGALTPQQIKTVIADFVGKANADDIYNKVVVKIDPSKLAKTSVTDEFFFPASTVQELVGSVTNPKLQKTIDKVLSDKQGFAQILKQAEELSKTQKIDQAWFQSMYSELVKSNPTIWDKATQSEFMNVVKKIGKTLVGSEKGGPSFTKIAGWILTSAIISVIYTDDNKLSAWMGECLESKNQTAESWANLQQTNQQLYNTILADCTEYVDGKETEDEISSGIGKIKNIYRGIVKGFGAGSDIKPAWSKPTSTQTQNQTQTTPKPEPEKPLTLDDF